MYRMILCIAAAVLLAAAVQPATADDRSVCGQGTGDEAIAACTRYLTLNPNDAVAYDNRGYAYNGKGDYDRAIADFDQAIRLNPKDAHAYSDRGAIYNKKGEYDRAISDLDQAIRFDPKLALAYAGRGEAYFHKGDHDRALADYDQALKLNPSLAEAWQGRERVPGSPKRVHTVPIRADQGTRTSPDRPAEPSAQNVRKEAATGRRIALVIGMTAYANVPPLRNPASDARAVADAFRRLGFAEVIEREDLTRAGLEEVLKDFGDKAGEADWAVIYYAGHGVEMNGENYLVPVDAKLARPDHIEDETVTVRRVLSKAEAARKLRMVILDACRNSPFRMASADGRSRAIGRGLSPLEPAGGVLVAFAARGGTIADDGGGEHSPFTQALLANLETPGLEINLMFRKVRDQVLARTNNAQEPFTYGSLPGEELYFKEAVAR
jgi:tetratricopeptide (TPR) repeat protein